MKRTQIVILALVALSIGACGKKSAFKAIGHNSIIDTSKADMAAQNNKPAEPTIEDKAVTLLTNDASFQARSKDASETLSEQVRGLTLKMNSSSLPKDDGRPMGAVNLTLTMSNKNGDNCESKVKQSEDFLLSTAVQKFVNLSKLSARFLCMEDACDNAILVLEAKRTLMNTTTKDVSGYETAAVAVLLKKDVNFEFSPVEAKSELFDHMLDASLGALNCDMALQDARNKATQDAIDKGQIPAETTHSKTDLSEQNRKDQATADAVRRGQIPAATLSNTDVSASDKARDAGRAAVEKAKQEQAARQAELDKQNTVSAINNGQIPAETNMTQAQIDAKRAKEKADADKAKADAAAKAKATADAIRRGQIPAASN